MIKQNTGSKKVYAGHFITTLPNKYISDSLLLN